MPRACRAAMVLLLLSACSPEQNWREWQTEGTSLTQLFPCKPVRQQRQVEVVGRQLRLVLHVCDGAGITWAQVHTDVADPAAVEPVLQALVSAAYANIGASPGSRQTVNVPGATPHPMSGRHRLRGKAPDGRDVEQAMLVFARGTVVVQVTALGGRLPEEAVDTFLGSVRATR